MNWITKCTIEPDKFEKSTHTGLTIWVKFYEMNRNYPACSIHLDIQNISDSYHPIFCAFVKTLLHYLRIQHVHVGIDPRMHTLISNYESIQSHACHIEQLFLELKQLVTNRSRVPSLSSLTTSVIISNLTSFSDIKSLELPVNIYESYFNFKLPGNYYFYSESPPCHSSQYNCIVGNSFIYRHRGCVLCAWSNKIPSYGKYNMWLNRYCKPCELKDRRHNENLNWDQKG